MTTSEWFKRFETGNQEIDEQHRNFINLLEDLKQSIHQKKTKEMIDKGLNTLVAYAHEHFVLEEKFMKEISYPQLADHQLKHAFFCKKSAELIEDYRTGKKEMIIFLVKFVSDWIQEHILEEDIRYIQWHKINSK